MPGVGEDVEEREFAYTAGRIIKYNHLGEEFVRFIHSPYNPAIPLMWGGVCVQHI